MDVPLVLLMIISISCSQWTKQFKPDILALGNNLAGYLLNATKLDAALIQNDLNKYLKMLNGTYNLMLSKNGADVTNGMDVFNGLEEQEGPPHVNITLADGACSSNDVHRISTILVNTREVWNQMVDRANRLRNGIPDPEVYDESESTNNEEKEEEDA